MGIKIFPKSLLLIDASLLLPGSTLFFFHCFLINSVESKTKKVFLIRFGNSRQISQFSHSEKFQSSIVCLRFSVEMECSLLCFYSPKTSRVTVDAIVLDIVVYMFTLFWIVSQSSAATCPTIGGRSWRLEEAFHWVSSIIQSTVPPLFLLRTHKAAHALII